MKKLLPFLALAVLISSCGNKMTLLKRHYTKGYYIHNSKHNENVAVNKRGDKEKAEKMQPTVTAFVNESQKPEVQASLTVKEVEAGKAKTYQQQLNKHIVAQRGSVTGQAYATKSNVALAKEVKKADKKNTTGGEGNIIVLVILSLFPLLCLIAMYIHDGHKVTTNFWVDLILHITIIGYAIFALLVVFDIVDLS